MTINYAGWGRWELKSKTPGRRRAGDGLYTRSVRAVAFQKFLDYHSHRPQPAGLAFIEQRGPPNCPPPPQMSQEEPPPQATPPLKPEEGGSIQRTSDYYRIDANLPSRFNYPAWFRGYRMKERNPLFRTTNMDYGGKSPTVHEMPTHYHTSSHAFSDTLVKFGMYRNNGINTSLEKSDVTGPDNFITLFDTYNFHPSYRTGGPSVCE